MPTLKDVIDKDDALAALAVLGNHAGLVAALSELDPDADPVYQPVPRKTFVAWGKSSGLWLALRTLRLTPITDENRTLQAAAQEVLALDGDCLDYLDMRLPIITQVADGFVSVGILTADQKTTMLALGTRTAYRWEALELDSAPTLDEVSNALRSN